MSLKYKFAGMPALQASSLAELREKLSDERKISDEALAAEVRRIFADADANDAKGELLDWLDALKEKEFCAALAAEMRTPLPIASYLLGDDTPRLERIRTILKAEAKAESDARKQAERKRTQSPLYKVVNLTDGSISGLEAVPNGGWSDEYKTTLLVLRRIDAGEFLMGSPDGESGRNSNETQHRVRLTQAYYIGVFAVTQRQWELVVGDFPSRFEGEKRPVECVSYDSIRGATAGSRWPASSDVDAESFLGRLRARTGCVGFDLPTEAQWEYACRAGTGGAHAGELKDYGWYDGNSGSQTHDVGTKRRNRWGLYDMHGNVWEWCRDWKQDYDGEAIDPTGPASGGSRVRRGGGWGNSAVFCRSAYRSYCSPGGACGSLGFRLCCSAGPAV